MQKCRHLKNLPVKGLFGRCLKTCVHSVMLVFSTQRCLLPLSLSLWFNSPPYPLSSGEDHHILQEFYTLHLTRFRTHIIARPPQTKREPRTNKYMPQSPFYRSISLDDDILHCLLWVLSFYTITPWIEKTPPPLSPSLVLPWATFIYQTENCAPNLPKLS